jgi:hypothetical protein
MQLKIVPVRTVADCGAGVMVRPNAGFELLVKAC